MWALLNEAGGDLQLETMPPGSLARIQRLLKGSADQERVTAFRDRLLDGAEYEIHALEV